MAETALGEGGAEAAAAAEIVGAGDVAALKRHIYDSTFSRTVWWLYGGAKGLVMWY